VTPSAPPVPRPLTRVVGIGASAGGLSALRQFLGQLPPDAGMAYVVVLHLSPEHKSHVEELLQLKTAMPVAEVSERVELQPDHVYVVPPDRNLLCADGGLEVTHRPPAGQNLVPIDTFFRSLADTHGAMAVAVVLSGTGTDGADGLRRVKEAGGLTMAQSPDDAEHSGMPRAAIGTGLVDRVLPAAALGPELVRLARDGAEGDTRREGMISRQEGEAPLPAILSEIRACTGHDFSRYKRPTVLRRLNRRIQLAGADTMDEYLRILQREPAEIEALDQDLLIAVTGFFRDPASFAALDEEVLPALLEGRAAGDAIRVWVPGCATGEEAYSLAILLQERAEGLDPPPSIKIFATDLSERACQVGRRGWYPKGIAADLTEGQLHRHFVRESDGFRVRKHVRESVVFAVHDLLRDASFPNLDLISCRNVLIYLEPDAQRVVLELLHYALRPDGYLFLGRSESVESARERFIPVDQEHRIFRPRSVPGERAPPIRSMAPPMLPLPSVPDGRGHAGRFPDPAGILHHRLVELYAPPSLVVNMAREVVHLSERAGRYLKFPGGIPHTNVLDMVPRELRLELRSLLQRAFETGEELTGPPVSVEVDGQDRTIRTSVRPIPFEETTYALIVFHDEPAGDAVGQQTEPSSPAETSRAHRLEEELAQRKEQLQAMGDEYERVIQEHQMANEELQAIIEEQHATAEELETSREELQSINQELQVVSEEHRVTIEELAEVNADLRNLIDSTDIATIFLDRTLAIRRYTPGATEVFRLRDTDIGRPLTDVTHTLDYLELGTEARSVVQTLDKVEREVRCRGSNGDRYFTVRIAPYRTLDHRIGGAVVTLVDTTGRRQAENDRERALEQAREASEAKSNLLGLVSHELRTPLTAVVGYAERLEKRLEGVLDGGSRGDLRVLKQAAFQLEEMVDQILTYARLEKRTEVLRVVRVDPVRLAEDVVALIAEQARRKDLEVRLELESDLPEFWTDEPRLKSILLNLLSNAVKYTQKGHVVLRVMVRNAGMLFEVEDTGVGIAPEDRERIFSPFERAHGSTAWLRGGTGLGLALVRKLVISLGGRVSLESEVGRGSRFAIWVPLTAPSGGRMERGPVLEGE
jgi:two-component system, chemotaxis family, CheB/CheR fusion protein